MRAKASSLDRIDPTQVPLPNGTKVTTRVERAAGERRIPQGAVGQVMATHGEQVEVRLASGDVVRYLRADVVPTKLGQLRYAVRRERAWRALRPCVVLTTVVGSRAWGLANEHSDTDRRGVFVLPFGWTTGLVEAPTELISADGSDTFWEIEKTIVQAMRADPNTLETLFLPGAQRSDPMGQWLLDVRDAFATREIYGSFGRYAISQLHKLRQSLRLAEHRHQLIAWLRADPTLSLDAAAARLVAATHIEAPSEADQQLRAKRYIKQLYISLYDQGLLPARDFAALVRFAQEQQLDQELPRQLRPKNAYNLIRLIATATDWLRTGEPTFAITGPLRDTMLAIKAGQVPLDDVLAMAEEMTLALDDARAHSKLPASPDVRRIDQLLRRVRHESARRHFEQAPGPFGTDAPPLPDVEPQ